MSIFSTSGAQALGGRVQADKAATRDAAARKPGSAKVTPARAEDELDLSVENTMTAGAIRNLKGNADEETHDDREQQDHYLPQHAQDNPAKPRLDVEG